MLNQASPTHGPSAWSSVTRLAGEAMPIFEAAPTMAGNFDPYYEWLGIPPTDRPLTHYRLLGISPFEENVRVIRNAADRQMAHLRTFQAGPRAVHSQRLLNEVSAAATCLQNAEKKEVYDAKLKSLGVEDQQTGEPIDESQEVDGTVFGEYILLDHLGTSSTGQVFKARHRTLDRVVALKVLSADATRSDEVVARFQRKVKIMARFEHPNLVAAYDAGQRNDAHYLVMPYIEGDELGKLRERFHPLPIPHVVNYIMQAASALGYAHKQGVIHREVKPSNLLVDQQGYVKVIGLGTAHWDFDSIHDLNTANTANAEALATLDYMAPEQILDSTKVDGRADIYSLGCTLYHVLTGQVPFPFDLPAQKIAAHRDIPAPSLRQHRSDASPDLDRVFGRMTAKQAEHRFQSMEDLIVTFQSIQNHLVVATGAPPVQTDQELSQFLGWVSQRENRR